jgi:hypothetical protein
VATSPSTIRNILGNPVVVLPLGAAIIVVLLSAVSGIGADPLVFNERFLIFLMCIPFVVGIALGAGKRFWNPARHGLLAWLGSTVLAFILSCVVFAYVAPADPAAYSDYNYLHFDRDAYVNANPRRRVVAGAEALPHTVYDLQANEVSLATLWRERPVVIEFGSVSCPVFDGQISPMEKLARDYKGQADFYVLYTREAHPGQNYPPHRNLDQKISYARDLQRIEGIERTVLIDDVAGSMHRDYGAWPDSAFIIGRDGRIAFLAQWNEPEKLRARLDILLQDDGYAAASPSVSLIGNSPGGGLSMLESSQRVLGRAGFAAVADFVVGFPKMMSGSSVTAEQPSQRKN